MPKLSETTANNLHCAVKVSFSKILDREKAIFDLILCLVCLEIIITSEPVAIGLRFVARVMDCVWNDETAGQ